MAQSCGGDAVSMQGAVVKALVRLVMERPVVLFAAKSGATVIRREVSGVGEEGIKRGRGRTG